MDLDKAAIADAVWLTAQLATLATILLLIVGTPVAWLLTRWHHWVADVIGAFVSLPLVLPPSVLGFYLLIAFAPDGPVSAVLRPLGVAPLAFTFQGLVVASVIYSLPFAVQPMRAAFEAIGPGPAEAAATLRAGPVDTFFHVTLPLARRGLLTAGILCFAHTVGEFGVVLMIGGNIPRQTRVLSIEIFNRVEAMEWTEAHILSGGLVAFALIVIFVVQALGRQVQQ
jgi:molybdate transport system permease protein